MPLMKWRPDLSVGVEKFDEHHRELVGLINDLHEAMKRGQAKDEIQDVIEDLKGYAEYHFEAEEEAMERHGYGRLEEQSRKHRRFKEKMEEYEGQFEEGDVTLTMNLIEFLKDWLEEHIEEEDMEYREFFQGKEV